MKNHINNYSNSKFFNKNSYRIIKKFNNFWMKIKLQIICQEKSQLIYVCLHLIKKEKIPDQNPDPNHSLFFFYYYSSNFNWNNTWLLKLKLA